MEREDILNRVDEQEQWVARALSGVQESVLFSAPATTDAEFLVRVRERIEKSRGTAVYKPQFLPVRRVAWVASACVILLVAIIAGGRFAKPYEDVIEEQLAEVPAPSTLSEKRVMASAGPLMADQLESVATMPTGTIVDSLAESDVDAVELAQYLDVPDYVEEDVGDTLEDLPLTDQLLALDTRTLEEVLDNLEDTEFF